MRSIHTTNQNKNNTPDRVIHQHRTKLGNPIWIIIMLAISIISLPLLSTFSIYADSNVLFSVNNNDTVLELTIPESINLNLAPNSANNYISFGTVDLNILAGTNNPSGYTLTMKADSDALARTSSITDGNGVTIAPTISPLSLVGSSVGYSIEDYRSNTYNNYTLNTWGYKKSTSTNFIPMPVADIELASTDTPGNATSTTLNFAAKVDSSIPAGIYNTTLNFNIVGNVPSAPTYKHEIIFNEYTFGQNDNCTMNIYTTFPEPFNSISVDSNYIENILYIETSQLTWKSGFGVFTPRISYPKVRALAARLGSFSFDSAPTLTINYESSIMDRRLRLYMNGTVNGSETSRRLDNIGIVSDTVTIVE